MSVTLLLVHLYYVIFLFLTQRTEKENGEFWYAYGNGLKSFSVFCLEVGLFEGQFVNCKEDILQRVCKVV
jgi:hypothetical protein